MVRTIANLSDRYARSSLDITNRQNFQLHWLGIEDVPTVWDELERVGWGSMGSCGDNTRTVTGCPLAGVDAHEVIDASPFALSVDRFLNGNPDYANLPRKFKITITGCGHWCSYPEINDIGATAARSESGEIGFHVRVGGGLSTRPHLAELIPAFVKQDQLLDVVTSITAIFRESDELRLNRAKARMKFLLINHGWTTERFLTEIERRIGYKLDPPAPEIPPNGSYRDHVGINPQQQQGMYYAGFSVGSGRITPEQLRRIAALADRFGDGTLRTTVMQNILVLNIPESSVTAFAAAAEDVGVPLGGSPFQRGTLSCTGREFCKLALTETKLLSIKLAHELEDRVPGFGENIKIHLSGCPNSCGQHWIADVGLQGVLLKVDGAEVEGFDFFIGGGVGSTSAIAHRIGYRAPEYGVADALTRLFMAYLREREPQETFRDWAARTGDAEVKRALVGADPGQDVDSAG
jgi:sulfite reductase (ferredoxin)